MVYNELCFNFIYSNIGTVIHNKEVVGPGLFALSALVFGNLTVFDDDSLLSRTWGFLSECARIAPQTPCTTAAVCNIYRNIMCQTSAFRICGIEAGNYALKALEMYPDNLLVVENALWTLICILFENDHHDIFSEQSIKIALMALETFSTVPSTVSKASTLIANSFWFSKEIAINYASQTFEILMKVFPSYIELGNHETIERLLMALCNTICFKESIMKNAENRSTIARFITKLLEKYFNNTDVLRRLEKLLEDGSEKFNRFESEGILKAAIAGLEKFPKGAAAVHLITIIRAFVHDISKFQSILNSSFDSATDETASIIALAAFYLKGTERTAFVKKYCTDAFNCADFNTDTLRFGLFLLLLCNNEDIDPIPMIRHSTKLTEALCREPLSDECSLGDPKIIEILLFYKRCFDSEKCMLTPLSVK